MLRAYAPEELHVTLAFLGKHDPGLEKKLGLLLRSLAIPGAEVLLGPLIALPQERRFSAIAWSMGFGVEKLNAVIEKRRARICREVGAKLDTRAPLPHITIARPERKISTEDRDLVLDWMPTCTPPAQRVVLDPPAIYRYAPPGSDRQFERVAGLD